ncbi:MAG: alpha/beta fold hydrolase [Elusimicrobiota bacterium]
MSSPRLSRVFLFSGMGADRRLLGPLRAQGFELLFPDHLAPQDRESLIAYAERTAEAHRIGPDDVVGGASFGGMLAAQISSRRKVAGVILLASCHRPGRLPGAYRAVELLSRVVPDAFIGVRSWRPLLRARMGPVDRITEDLLVEMAAGYSPEKLRRFGRMIVEWPGVETFPCPMLAVHGAEDRVLPSRCIDAHLVLPRAGHAFTLTHSEPINAAIRDFLTRLAESES